MIEFQNYDQLPIYAYNHHLATIIPSLFRNIKDVNYSRERLYLKDKDFIDLDLLKNNNNKIVILTHGLEGNSEKHYIKGTAKLFLENNWDVIAWNCRSCSGELNNARRIYHHGDTDDISEVVNWASLNNHYKTIGLIGYSMGGVINTKYLATRTDQHPATLSFNIAVSTPCDLEACALTLDQSNNIVYKRKFLNSLKKKLILKSAQFPDYIDIAKLHTIKFWSEFDEHFSAKMNGFANRKEFYQQATLLNFLEDVKIPTLILNAENDPLIPVSSNPVKIAKNNKYIELVLSKYGGHCGFTIRNNAYTYAERCALEFANEVRSEE